MSTVNLSSVMARPADQDTIVRAVTVIMGTVVGLTFLFGFGNVLNLALTLGVPVWVAPLVATAVDLSILGLLLGVRHLALNGATSAELRPARRLLIFSSVVTLALNIADPLIAAEYGKAAFDSVGPLLLIGWAEVGPGLLQAVGAVGQARTGAIGEETVGDVRRVDTVHATVAEGGREVALSAVPLTFVTSERSDDVDGSLLECARQEDARHWAAYRRPISAETLRKRLRIGAARSRTLVSKIRADRSDRTSLSAVDQDEWILDKFAQGPVGPAG